MKKISTYLLCLIFSASVVGCNKKKSSTPQTPAKQNPTPYETCKGQVLNLLGESDFRDEPVAQIGLRLLEGEFKVDTLLKTPKFASLAMKYTDRGVPGFIAWRACSQDDPNHCSNWHKEWRQSFESVDTPQGLLKISVKRCVEDVTYLKESDWGKFARCNSESSNPADWCCDGREYVSTANLPKQALDEELHACLVDNQKYAQDLYAASKSIIQRSTQYLSESGVRTLDQAKQDDKTHAVWNLASWEPSALATVIDSSAEGLTSFWQSAQTAKTTKPLGLADDPAKQCPAILDDEGAGEFVVTGTDGKVTIYRQDSSGTVTALATTHDTDKIEVVDTRSGSQGMSAAKGVVLGLGSAVMLGAVIWGGYNVYKDYQNTKAVASIFKQDASVHKEFMKALNSGDVPDQLKEKVLKLTAGEKQSAEVREKLDKFIADAAKYKQVYDPNTGKLREGVKVESGEFKFTDAGKRVEFKAADLNEFKAFKDASPTMGSTMKQSWGTKYAAPLATFSAGMLTTALATTMQLADDKNALLIQDLDKIWERVLSLRTEQKQAAVRCDALLASRK